MHPRTTPTEQERYARARRRVQAIKGFYSHLTAYVLVNLLLFGIDMLDGGGDTWFYWPLMGWGIGLAAHWSTVFGPQRRFSADWEERKIRELMEQDQHRS